MDFIALPKASLATALSAVVFIHPISSPPLAQLAAENQSLRANPVLKADQCRHDFLEDIPAYLPDGFEIRDFPSEKDSVVMSNLAVKKPAWSGAEWDEADLKRPPIRSRASSGRPDCRENIQAQRRTS